MASAAAASSAAPPAAQVVVVLEKASLETVKTKKVSCYTQVCTNHSSCPWLTFNTDRRTIAGV